MRTLLPSPLPRALLLVALLLGLVLAPREASAAGTVRLSTQEPVEADGKWKLNMTIDYGSIPHLPHIPMLFVFTPTVHYDLALTDKSPEKPVLTKIPLQNQQPINESLDVGFSDASGKVFKITKFDFVIRRDHGFEAGEYELKIKREDDGVQLGQTFRLVLKGENTVVDRRAIVFAGEKSKKEKKAEADAEKKDDASAEKKDDAPADKPAEDKPADDAPAPPPVPPKQGGCGCRVGGAPAPAAASTLAMLAIAAMIGARRVRRRR